MTYNVKMKKSQMLIFIPLNIIGQTLSHYPTLVQGVIRSLNIIIILN